ncbi:MAG: nuclear transport factor 2 family protein [Actinocatenispora sp.]
MAQTTNTRAVVSDYVAALVKGDVDALRASFAADATWTMPGDLPVSGTWTGPDQIIDGFLAGMMERLDPTVPVQVEPGAIIADGELAVAQWTSRARTRDGQQYENDYSVLFRVRDSKIVEVFEYLDTLYAHRVLFGG